MVRIHPQTRQRFVAPRHAGDIVIDAKGPPALSQERVKIIGGWKDYTGSGGVPTKQVQFFAGLNNQLFGTDAWVEGADNPERDVLGNPTSSWRLRQKKIYIDLTKKN